MSGYTGPSEGQQFRRPEHPSPVREFHVLPSGRKDYVSTPFLMDNLHTPDGTTYYNAVRLKILSLVGLKGHDAISSEDIQSPGVRERPQRVRLFAFVSLMGSVNERFEHGREALHAHELQCAEQGIVLDEQLEDMVERAKRGSATMDELLLLPAEVPTLPAAEIAKLSHPFDWNATSEMDVEVHQTIKRQGERFGLRWLTGDIVPDNPLGTEYIYRGSDHKDDPSTLILARKERIAVVGDSLLITNRSALMINFVEKPGEEGMFDAPPELKKWCLALVAAKNNSTPDERVQASMKLAQEKLIAKIAQYVENQLTLEPSEREKWLSPMSTSYYSRPFKPDERLAYQSILQAPASRSVGSAALFSAAFPQTA